MSVARYLEPEERTRLLRQLQSPRDRLLVQLGLCTGFRISEILSLRWRQVWTAAGPAREIEIPRRCLKNGRGSRRAAVRSRRVPVLAPVAEALREHLFAEFGSASPPQQDWLFPSPRNPTQALTRRQAYGIIVAAANRAGLDGAIGTHSLRRSLATDCYRALGLIETRDLLSHSSVTVSELYVHSDPRRLAGFFSAVEAHARKESLHGPAVATAALAPKGVCSSSTAQRSSSA